MVKPFTVMVLGLALASAGCDRKYEGKDLTPLTGVGGNVYCVGDADEAKLKGEANSDAMATWILIHHYNNCEPDKDRSAQLLQMQMNRGDAAMMDSLADFNRRIELGRKELATK